MALHGPASVLDSREIRSRENSSHVVRDRLTRHRSPARSSNRWSYTSEEDSGDEDVIKPKIPQPYKTSFSAIAPPDRIRRDRSRSTSPCTSSLKGSNRNRSKSPGRRSNRHVTYDEKVVIRGSETSDSQVTNLSDKDLNETSGHFSANSSMMETDMSNSSQRDISLELRELSQQIVKEYSSPETRDSPDLSSQNQNHKSSTPNGTAKVMATNNGSMKPRQNVKVVSEGGQKKKIIVSENYENERSVSYRVAVTNNYSDEIKQQAEEVMKDVTPKLEVEADREPTVNETKDLKSRERHNSLPNEKDEVESSKLTPAKRSISSSIGNFFRRLSPHVGRRNKKGNLSTASSQSLSPGDDLDGSFQRHNSTSSLSRGKLRRSLMKLMGKSKKSSKSSNKSDSSIEDLNLSNNSNTDSSKRTPKSALYMKSIEQTSKNDKDLYHKFKDRKKQKSGEVNATGKAVKASPKYSYPDSDKPSTTETSVSSLLSGDAIECDSPVKARPPDTLDVKLVPKSIQALQASQISTISGDDSIGDCSIDPNLTGSEPSLISETSASKQVEVSRLSDENVNPVSSTPLSSAGHKNEKNQSKTDDDKVLSDHKEKRELQLSYPQMPIIADSADYFPTETPTRTPSYLRISSAVSGYGHYSKYSAYKGIEKRSPYSSTLSLRSSRSDLTTPISPVDMPIGKIPNIQAPTNWPPLKNEILSPKGDAPKAEVEFNKSIQNGASDIENEHVNGDIGCEVAVNGENGHITHEGNYVSTGDSTKDGDYFLGLAQAEENRLLLLCSKCEMELMNDSISEEGSGKVRSAVGKANLLISQKFRQFQDLCQQHKNPDPDPEVKPTLLEDLQGFWEMVKLQVDDVDEMFTQIDMMRQNGWREIKIPSRRSSSSSRSSPKSSSLNVSNASTPSHTPGSRRRAARMKDTPESSPERSQKAKMAAKVRDDARKKMLAEKRAAMKQQRQQENEAVEIYVADNGNKSDSPGRNSGSDVNDA